MSEVGRIAEIEARRNLDACPAHTDCLRSDVAYLLTELKQARGALAEAWEQGKDAGLNGGWDNPYEVQHDRG